MPVLPASVRPAAASAGGAMGCSASKPEPLGTAPVASRATPLKGVPADACHLRVVHFNDVYSLDMLPRIAAAARRQRGVANTTLVTLSGDFLGPSALSMMDGGDGMVDTLIASGVTHLCFGNHEQDIPLTSLRKHCAELRTRGVKWINTNMPAFEPSLPADDAVTVSSAGGRHKRTVKIGGFMTNEESLFREGSFGDAWKGMPGVNGTAAAWSRKAVGEEGFDTTLVMTHQDQPDDEALAAMGLPISLILGGHDHFQRYIEGPNYLICKTGKDAMHACVIDLVWPTAENKAPLIRHCNLRMLDFKADARVQAVVDKHHKKLSALESATLFQFDADTPHVDARERDTPLARHLLTAARAVTKADLALCHGGCVRGVASFKAGEFFTYRDLLGIFPYEKQSLAVRMPGSVLQAALVESRRKAKDGGFAGFLQVDEGVVLGEDGHIRSIGGEPFDPARAYRVLGPHVTLSCTYDKVDALTAFFGQPANHLPHVDAGVPLKIFVLEYFMRLFWERMPAFAALDRDGSGDLSQDEVLHGFQSAFTLGDKAGNKLMAKFLLEALDADSDGRISRAEYESIFQDGIGAH